MNIYCFHSKKEIELSLIGFRYYLFFKEEEILWTRETIPCATPTTDSISLILFLHL